MFHLIYTSTQRNVFSPSDLKLLLIAARLRNTADSITGMLLYDGGTFLQALEGDESAVTQTFNRIDRDRRHKDIRTVHRNFAKQRMFGNWSMGFESADGTAKILKGFMKLNNVPGLATLDDESAVRVLSNCSKGLGQQ